MSTVIESGIYAIRNTTNGKLYVSSAINIRRRFVDHLAKLRLGKHHNVKLQNAWNKHGENAFVFEILEVVQDLTSLLATEQRYIDERASHGTSGYNIAPKAGSNFGLKRSAEAIAKGALAHRGRKNGPETIRRMSEAAMGRTFSTETRAKLSATLTGSKHTFEAREKIRLAMSGRKLSTATLAKMRAAAVLRMADKEHRYRLAVSNAAKSVEERSASAHKAWETKHARQREAATTSRDGSRVST